MLISSILISAAFGVVGDRLLRYREASGRARRRSQPVLADAGRPARDGVPAKSGRFFGVAHQSPRQLVVAGGIAASIAVSPVVPAALLLVPALAMGEASDSVRAALIHLRRHKTPNEDALDTAVTLLALVTQAFSIIAFIALLRWLRQRLVLAVRDRSRRDLGDLFGLQGQMSWLQLPDGTEAEVPVARLAVGDLIVVHSGETMPVDGVVVDGQARVDQRMLTGEEQLAELLPGDQALAASQVLSGRLVVRTVQTGAETTAGRVIALLEHTTEYRLTIDTRAEVLQNRTVPYRLVAGAVVAPFLGLYRAAGAINTGPFAFANIYLPIGMLETLSEAGRRGILIRDGRTLEILPRVDTIVFDKTGTLTEPVPRVTHVHAAADATARDLLLWAAAAEHRQVHPIARAIRAEAERLELVVAGPDDMQTLVGHGVSARVDGASVLVGSSRLMALSAIDLDPHLMACDHAARQRGCSVVHIARDGRHLGVIELDPRLRAEAAGVVASLRDQGLQVRILSGDGHAQTRKVAEALGVDGFDAEVLPQDKAAVVKRLQDEGRIVCFVGDGVNDVVALRQANVSVAVADATAAATSVAGVVLLDHDLRLVPALADIARAFDRRSRQAIVLASAPTVASFGLILFGGFGLLASSVANQASAVIGLAVMLKRGKHVPQRFLPTSALPTMVPTKARASRSDRR